MIITLYISQKRIFSSVFFCIVFLFSALIYMVVASLRVSAYSGYHAHTFFKSFHNQMRHVFLSFYLFCNANGN